MRRFWLFGLISLLLTASATVAQARRHVGAPVNTAVPTISGVSTQGQALATTTGSWSNGPTSYSYAWKDCDSAGSNCAAISGAASSSYTLQATDVGHTIRSVVTARNAYGSASSASAQTPIVGALSSLPAPVGVPGSWTPTLNDNFTTFDANRWVSRFWWNGDTFWPTHELEVYRPSQAVASGGLALTAQRYSGTLTNFNGYTANSDGLPFSWLSGFVSSGGIQNVAPVGFAQKYGYFEASIKMPPAGAGFWPAFWLEGVNGATGSMASSYDDCPEIDVVEVIPSDPNDVQMHLPCAGSNWGAQYYPPTPVMGGGYHTYGVDWEPGFVAWYVDGRKVAQYTGTALDNQPPHYIMLDFAIGDQYSWPGGPNSSTPSPASMLVSYVRAWSH